MHIMEIQNKGKAGTLEFLTKMQNAKHMKMWSIQTKEATSVKIEPMTHSYFNIDGEIYQNDHV